MLKLYHRNTAGQFIAYHEVWVEPENRRIIEHWGNLGEVGDTASHRVWLLGRLETQIDRILAPARAAGFTEISEADGSVLLVEYQLQGGDDDEAMDKRQDLEERLNEILGWTGLGYCDRGRSGTETMAAECFVVDVDLAMQIITDALSEDDYFRDYSRIYKE